MRTLVQIRPKKTEPALTALSIPQYETEEFIQEGLQKLKEWNPGWSSQFFMTDKSAQELGIQLYVDAMCSINNELLLLYLIHKGLSVKFTLTASG